MSMILDISGASECLHVCATGTFSLKEAKRTFREMLEAAVSCKARKVLVDGRALAGEPRAMERFYYGEFAAREVWSYADRGLSPATPFAYVLLEPVLDPARFGENVARNRGLNVKVFAQLGDALEWLGLAPAQAAADGGGRIAVSLTCAE